MHSRAFRQRLSSTQFRSQHPARTENVTSRYIETPFHQFDSFLVQPHDTHYSRFAPVNPSRSSRVKFRIETAARRSTCLSRPMFVRKHLAHERVPFTWFCCDLGQDHDDLSFETHLQTPDTLLALGCQKRRVLVGHVFVDPLARLLWAVAGV